MRTGRSVIVVHNWQYRAAKEGRMGTFSVQWLLENNHMLGLDC